MTSSWMHRDSSVEPPAKGKTFPVVAQLSHGLPSTYAASQQVTEPKHWPLTAETGGTLPRLHEQGFAGLLNCSTTLPGPSCHGSAPVWRGTPPRCSALVCLRYGCCLLKEPDCKSPLRKVVIFQEGCCVATTVHGQYCAARTQALSGATPWGTAIQLCAITFCTNAVHKRMDAVAVWQTSGSMHCCMAWQASSVPTPIGTLTSLEGQTPSEGALPATVML